MKDGQFEPCDFEAVNLADDAKRNELVELLNEKTQPKKNIFGIVATAVAIIALIFAGVIGPIGPQGNPGIQGPMGITGKFDSSVEASLRQELAEMKAKLDEKIVEAETPKAIPVDLRDGHTVHFDVDEQSGDLVVTSLDHVQNDSMLGKSIWVCKGPTGQVLAAEPGTPNDFMEKYVKFKVDRPAGTVLVPHPKPSKRGSTVWVLVKK